jgi:hypothetical protein
MRRGEDAETWPPASESETKTALGGKQSRRHGGIMWLGVGNIPARTVNQIGASPSARAYNSLTHTQRTEVGQARERLKELAHNSMRIHVQIFPLVHTNSEFLNDTGGSRSLHVAVCTLCRTGSNDWMVKNSQERVRPGCGITQGIVMRRCLLS